jgi:hypothetical protein
MGSSSKKSPSFGLSISINLLEREKGDGIKVLSNLCPQERYFFSLVSFLSLILCLVIKDPLCPLPERREETIITEKMDHRHFTLEEVNQVLEFRLSFRLSKEEKSYLG